MKLKKAAASFLAVLALMRVLQDFKEKRRVTCVECTIDRRGTALITVFHGSLYDAHEIVKALKEYGDLEELAVTSASCEKTVFEIRGDAS